MKHEAQFNLNVSVGHGGCRRVYNQEGDLAVAQQLLGNSDLKSTLVYADEFHLI